MIDKEKLDAIRAEIHRLVDVRGYDREMANDLFAFMDSLPNEPISIDFEQELYKAFGQVKDFTLCMQIAQWFYYMGKKSREPVSEGLEEAAFDYAETCKYDGGEKLLCVEHFKAGAKWQKEQMMAKAVDAKLLEGHLIRQKGITHPLHVGDKVKVIIIKED